MAIWQFNLYTSPRGGPLPVHGPDGIELTPSSRGAADIMMATLLEKLGKPVELYQQVFCFGDPRETCVRAIFDADHPVEFGIRVDARKPDGKIVGRFCRAAAASDFALYDPQTRTWVDPTADAVFEWLRNSPAAAFVSDPHEYLKSLRTDWETQ